MGDAHPIPSLFALHWHVVLVRCVTPTTVVFWGLGRLSFVVFEDAGG